MPIHEEHAGQVVWDGTVAVFDLAEHPKAKAVRAAIVEEAKAKWLK